MPIPRFSFPGFTIHTLPLKCLPPFPSPAPYDIISDGEKERKHIMVCVMTARLPWNLYEAKLGFRFACGGYSH
eukprot:509983-Pyramimonas_sp.AAC.1